MIETVYLVSIRGRSRIQYCEERLVSGGGEMFHFYMDGERARQVEDLCQPRDRFSIRQPGLSDFSGADGGDEAVPRKIGVMVHHDDVVAGSVNVQFDPVSALVYCRTKRRQGVLVILTRRATMGDDERMGNWCFLIVCGLSSDSALSLIPGGGIPGSAESRNPNHPPDSPSAIPPYRLTAL